MILFLWLLGLFCIAAITIGTVIILRMRKRHREMEKDFQHRLRYYEKGGVGISYERK